jgi:hypothetical protein
VGRNACILGFFSLTLVLKGIPGQMCAQCGEGYFDESTTKRIEEIAEQAERAGVQAVTAER